ncbi:hypothetical protein NMY22_g2102 [Coprinellus aureogranulatus]|nr:hypothetical protein NMY22_g2102 [Coprinellus aureogranulatus]
MIIYRSPTRPDTPAAPPTLEIPARATAPKAWTTADWTSEVTPPFSPTAKEELLVEQLLLNADDGRPARRLLTGTVTLPPPQQPYLVKSFYFILARAFAILRWTARTTIIFAGLLIVMSFILVHAAYRHYIWSLPSFCRQPGMEAYLFTYYCQPVSGPLATVADVSDDDTPLLDGPPPHPIYWADFDRLYELQIRMAEEFCNATTSASSTKLKSLFTEMTKDDQSDPSRLWRDVRLKDPFIGDILQDTLYIGGHLGASLNSLHEKAIFAVKMRVHYNERIVRDIEKAAEMQPRNALHHIVASLFPRFRSIAWSWEMDKEVRWQFYSELTDFWQWLYEDLLKLNDLASRLQSFGESLQPFLGRDEDTKMHRAVDTSEKNSFPEPDEVFLRMQNIVGGLANDSQVALSGVQHALTSLRQVSQELEDLRQRVAIPGPHIPFYVHLRNIHAAGKMLNLTLKTVEPLGG